MIFIKFAHVSKDQNKTDWLMVPELQKKKKKLQWED